jgi:8-oxo-dGTP pyrophosphatase MutT (NUDIX family)
VSAGHRASLANVAKEKEKAQVKAAGGVVVRKADGKLEVALIHRPRYGDWSLPKGKLEGEEGFKQAALREVEEETGFTCELGRELSSASYRDRKGRRKIVRYWEMSPRKGKFKVNDEVDELRWVPLKKAADMLDYDHDRKLIAEVRKGD